MKKKQKILIFYMYKGTNFKNNILYQYIKNVNNNNNNQRIYTFQQSV